MPLNTVISPFGFGNYSAYVPNYTYSSQSSDVETSVQEEIKPIENKDSQRTVSSGSKSSSFFEDLKYIESGNIVLDENKVLINPSTYALGYYQVVPKTLFGHVLDKNNIKDEGTSNRFSEELKSHLKDKIKKEVIDGREVHYVDEKDITEAFNEVLKKNKIDYNLNKDYDSFNDVVADASKQLVGLIEKDNEKQKRTELGDLVEKYADDVSYGKYLLGINGFNTYSTLTKSELEKKPALKQKFETIVKHNPFLADVEFGNTRRETFLSFINAINKFRMKQLENKKVAKNYALGGELKKYSTGGDGPSGIVTYLYSPDNPITAMKLEQKKQEEEKKWIDNVNKAYASSKGEELGTFKFTQEQLKSIFGDDTKFKEGIYDVKAKVTNDFSKELQTNILVQAGKTMLGKIMESDKFGQAQKIASSPLDKFSASSVIRGNLYNQSGALNTPFGQSVTGFAKGGSVSKEDWFDKYLNKFRNIKY